MIQSYCQGQVFKMKLFLTKCVFFLFLFVNLIKCGEIESLLSEPKNENVTLVNIIHKCFCPADSIFINAECIPSETYINVVKDINSKISHRVLTSDADEIIVSTLICNSSYFSVNFTKENWSFLPSGQIFHSDLALIFDDTKYCIEYQLDGNDNTQMEVSVCVPIPSLPRCCPDVKLHNDTNICFDPDKDIQIPVSIGSSYFSTTLSSFVNDVVCEGRLNKTEIDIYGTTRDKPHLKINNEGIFLYLRPEIQNIQSLSEVDDDDQNLLKSSEYCVSVDQRTGHFSATYCHSDPLTIYLKKCANSLCIRKCCPHGRAVNVHNTFKCADVDESKYWSPTFYNADENHKIMEQDVEYVTTYGHPLCNHEYFPISSVNEPKDIYRLLSNSSLYIENWGYSLPSYHFCMDTFLYGDIYLEEAMACYIAPSEVVYTKLVCNYVSGILYPVLLGISCVFIIITIAVYVIIPELHAKVQGKCLISSLCSLLAAYLSLVIVGVSSEYMPMPVCTMFGILTQYSVLSSFFWLNVMCYDIWRTLRSLTSGRESIEEARKRFALYSAYAWGFPFLISGVTITIHLLPPSDLISVRPLFGNERCFFPLNDSTALWVYLYGFILGILAINFILFIHLAIIIRRTRLESSKLEQSKNIQATRWAKLYMKLFLVMGVTWIFEAASWVSGSCGFWILTDIINSLRGVFIFVIFVCKKDVFKDLRSESTPALIRMRATFRQGSSFFSRSTSSRQRTTSFYVEPTDGAEAPAIETNTASHPDRDVAM